MRKPSSAQAPFLVPLLRQSERGSLHQIGGRRALRHYCSVCRARRRFAKDAHTSSWALGKFVHSRSHFSTNVSVAGGLLLLAGIGAGRFTVDNMMGKKDN